MCATPLARADEETGARCESCGRSWYRNAAPTAGCAIVRDGKALVTTRGSEPEKGRQDVPGGFLRYDEHPIDGVKREVREELGIEIAVTMADCLQIVPHRYGAEGDWVLAIGFKARYVAGDPVPADDVAAITWVGPHELDDLDFAWGHDRDLVRSTLQALA